MKKTAFLFFLCLTGFFPLAAQLFEDDVPAESVPWHDPAAPYRIEFLAVTSKLSGIVDDRRLCLPASFENGVRLCGRNGMFLPVRLHKDGGAMFLSPSIPEEMYLYFGYEETPKDLSKEKLKQNENLTLFLGRGAYSLALDPEEWCEEEIRNLRKRRDSLAEKWKPPFCGQPPHVCSCPALFCRICHPFLEQYYAWEKVYLPLSPSGRKRFPVRNCRAPAHPHAGPLQLALHAHFQEYAMLRSMRNLWKSQLKIDADIAELQKPDVYEEKWKKALFSFEPGPRPDSSSSCQISLMRRPFDTGDRSLLYYKGLLYAPETGLYRFRITANSTRLLWIGKELLICSPGAVPPLGTSPETTECEVHLTEGPHKFQLCYLKKNKGTSLSASWKTPSSAQFRILNESDFCAGMPASIRAVRSRSGECFPLVMRRDAFQLFTGKRDRAAAEMFFPASPDMPPLCFFRGGTEYPAERNLFFTPCTEEGNNGITVFAEGFEPLKIAPHPRSSPRISVPVSLRLELHLPLFLYDDETLSGSLNILHRFPFPFTAELREKSEDGAETCRFLSFPAHQQEDSDRFAPDDLRTLTFDLDGRKSAKIPESRQYRIEINDFFFDGKKYRVCPVSEAGAFTFLHGQFLSEDGCRLVFLLHRTTVSEIRTWELLRDLRASLSSPRKVFAAVPETGGMQKKMERELQKRNIPCDIRSWSRVHSGSPVASSLSGMLEGIRNSGADTVLLVPPSQAFRAACSLRDEIRCFAFLIEAARQMPGVRRILISTPPPSVHADENIRKEDLAFSAELRHLQRSEGVTLIDLCERLPGMTGSDSDFADAVEFLLQFL